MARTESALAIVATGFSPADGRVIESLDGEVRQRLGLLKRGLKVYGAAASTATAALMLHSAGAFGGACTALQAHVLAHLRGGRPLENAAADYLATLQAEGRYSRDVY